MHQDEGVLNAEVKSWCQCFQYLLFKIKLRDLMKAKKVHSIAAIQPRQLLLKSPCHTGRARLLTKLYPDAKFVFIHRNPFEVFLSGAHMASTTYGYMFLQEPTDEILQEYILSQGEILHREYFSCVNLSVLNDKVRTSNIFMLDIVLFKHKQQSRFHA